MNKHDLRVLKTKKILHQALILLLKERPLTSIKVTELCKVANINRGTFYFHYAEISDVFEELFNEMMADLRVSYAEPYKKTPKLEARNLDAKTVKIFDHVKKYEQFYSIILSKDAPLKYYYLLYDEIQSNFELTQMSEISEQLLPFFKAYSANAIIGLIITWSRRDFIDSIEEMNTQLVNIVKSYHKDEHKPL